MNTDTINSINCSTFSSVNSDSKTTVLRVVNSEGFRSTVVFDAFKINSVIFLSSKPDEVFDKLKQCFSQDETFKPSCSDDIDKSISELSADDIYTCVSIESEEVYDDFIQTLKQIKEVPENAHILVLLPLNKVDIKVLTNLIYHTSSFLSKDGTGPMIHFITIGDSNKYQFEEIIDEVTESGKLDNDKLLLQDLFTFQFIINLDKVCDNVVYSKKTLEDDYLAGIVTNS